MIVVSGSPYRIDTTDFADTVRKYNLLEPFNFNAGSPNFSNFGVDIHVSIYAAHLYDSMVLYAKALHKMIEDAKARNEAYSVHDLARDGTQITDTIIEMGGYNSISGNYIRIDKNGDSEGNFTVFALKDYNYTYFSKFTNKISFECNHYLAKVGDFHVTNSTNKGDKRILPEYAFFDR